MIEKKIFILTIVFQEIERETDNKKKYKDNGSNKIIINSNNTSNTKSNNNLGEIIGFNPCRIRV